MYTRQNDHESYMITVVIVGLLLFIVLSLPGCLQGERGIPGPSGVNGAVGPAGASGSQGPQGQQGLPGVDITPVTVVYFCANVTPQYPTTFPETGLCIAGNIYAVYSIENSFLTEIPPGNYQSNAIGSACTFTVLPNCEIQN